MARELKGRYTSFESILHQLVHERIETIIVERSINLGEGGARKDDAVATAIAYHETIASIRALREAQQICEEIARQLARDG